MMLTVVGCQSAREFSDSDFGDIVSLKGEEHNIATSLSIRDIWSVKDSFIVAHMRGQRDSVIVVIDAQNWSIKTSLKGLKGDAKLIKSRENIMVFDPIPSRVSIFDTKGEQQSKIWNIPTDDIAQNIHHDGHGYIYENYDLSLQKRLIYLNRDSKFELTDFSQLLKTTPDASIHQGFTGVSRNAHKAIYAYKYLHRVDIFDTKEGTVLVSINPTADQPKIEGGVTNTPNSTTHYNGAFTTHNKIYLYYVGAPLKSKPTTTYVEEWDWDGKPIRKYALDGCFDHFCYINGHFVGHSNSKGSTLVSYKIE